MAETVLTQEAGTERAIVYLTEAQGRFLIEVLKVVNSAKGEEKILIGQIQVSLEHQLGAMGALGGSDQALARVATNRASRRAAERAAKNGGAPAKPSESDP